MPEMLAIRASGASRAPHVGSVSANPDAPEEAS